MPLAADQKALLELILQRGQSYGDLAGLLGISEPEVRARARAALAELGGADPDRRVGLTDYLLGQADPIGRADAARHLREDPDDLRLATDLAERLRGIAPQAELPRLVSRDGARRPSARRARIKLPGLPRRPTGAPAEAGPVEAPATTPAAGTEPLAPGTALTTRQMRLIAGLASGAVLLIAVILGVAGVFGGDDEGGADPRSADDTSLPGASGGDREFLRIPLAASGGGDASGTAVIGLASADQPYLDLSLRGLEPAPSDKTYILWMLFTENRGYPMVPLPIPGSGRFDDRFAIPAPFLPLLPRVQLVDISLAETNAAVRAIQRGLSNEQLVLERPGESILRGEVPRGQTSPSGESG